MHYSDSRDIQERLPLRVRREQLYYCTSPGHMERLAIRFAQVNQNQCSYTSCTRESMDAVSRGLKRPIEVLLVLHLILTNLRAISFCSR